MTEALLRVAHVAGLVVVCIFLAGIVVGMGMVALSPWIMRRVEKAEREVHAARLAREAMDQARAQPTGSYEQRKPKAR